MGKLQSTVRERESSSAKCSVGAGAQSYQFPTNRLESAGHDDQLATNLFGFNREADDGSYHSDWRNR